MGIEPIPQHIPEDNGPDPWDMQICVNQTEGGQTSVIEESVCTPIPVSRKLLFSNRNADTMSASPGYRGRKFTFCPTGQDWVSVGKGRVKWHLLTKMDRMASLLLKLFAAVPPAPWASLIPVTCAMPLPTIGPLHILFP